MYQETTECPYCGALCDNAEFVHIDFGHYVQATPFGCDRCGASQYSPFYWPRSLRERVYGWYPPQWGGPWLWVRTWVEALWRWYVR